MDLNADVGEGGDDEELIAIITQANVACGGHTGDTETMARTVERCRKHGVKIGAHPSYPDRAGFGRRALSISDDDLATSLRSQIQSLLDVAGTIDHLKPHGALYHAAASDPAIAKIILDVAGDIPVMLMAGCATRQLFPRFLGEGFADRRYGAEGLLPRSDPRALITDPLEAAAQARELAMDANVTTICVHSDTPNAVAIARAVRGALNNA